MIRTLVLKELRESLPIVAVAGLAIAFILVQLCGLSFFAFFGYGGAMLPFIADAFWKWVAIIGIPFAIFLALKQTQWEEMKGTYRYLLFRPVDRKQFFLWKIIVGLSLLTCSMAIAIVAYGLWATLPGRHASPFYWSMTVPSWHAWFVLPVMYSAAFLCGVRPGRWFGSKLLPLAGASMLALLLLAQPWPWIALVGSVIATALYASVAIDVVRSRDY